ncbi:hypothetical protein [Clostridium saccharoperbutylacetonicum]|uniref:hypothetical protein n=1 Tax=Clostridium saccharoperbutylacetonicum TaxID=36745 RepID=UPI0039E84CDE
MKFSVNIKGETDEHITDLESDSIPQANEVIQISKECKPIKSYLVKSVERYYNIQKENETWKYKEFITVYVSPY